MFLVVYRPRLFFPSSTDLLVWQQIDQPASIIQISLGFNGISNIAAVSYVLAGTAGSSSTPAPPPGGVNAVNLVVNDIFWTLNAF